VDKARAPNTLGMEVVTGARTERRVAGSLILDVTEVKCWRKIAPLESSPWIYMSRRVPFRGNQSLRIGKYTRPDNVSFLII